MGHVNQFNFVRDRRADLAGPILEVGSHDYGNTQNVRELFDGQTYVGLDMIDGPGVDIALDLTRPFDEIDAALDGRRFGTILCFSVMEHCDQPFAMAENMTRLLADDGVLVLSVPFAWKFHGYPSDYWRFTHEGIKKLFPNLHFDDNEGIVFHTFEGDVGPIDKDLGRVHLSGKRQRKAGHPMRGLTLSVLKLLGPLNPMRWLTKHQYVMAATSIIMIGRKRA